MKDVYRCIYWGTGQLYVDILGTYQMLLLLVASWDIQQHWLQSAILILAGTVTKFGLMKCIAMAMNQTYLSVPEHDPVVSNVHPG